MIVAFDYDGTWTRAPALFREVVEMFQVAGHTCLLVTGRMDEHGYGNEVRAAIGNIMPVIFADKTWKREAARAAGYEVDVWVDDRPEYVALQDPRWCANKMPTREGWHDTIGGARIRFEQGVPVEIATAPKIEWAAKLGEKGAKMTALVAAEATLGGRLRLWDGWARHPSNTRLYARVARW
jgi:hypothetical protein